MFPTFGVVAVTLPDPAANHVQVRTTYPYGYQHAPQALPVLEVCARHARLLSRRHSRHGWL